MIVRIILRQNEIGDDGAKDLAKFIEANPQNFEYLEISRN
jgi:hypothetical protein